VTENEQHAPLTWREPAKINKLLLAENVATHSQNLKKNYVLQQEFFVDECSYSRHPPAYKPVRCGI
jgi:hypothetical protein